MKIFAVDAVILAIVVLVCIIVVLVGSLVTSYLYINTELSRLQTLQYGEHIENEKLLGTLRAMELTATQYLQDTTPTSTQTPQ